MVGSYDASTGTWTNGATYSLTRNGNNFTVTGTIPYGQADAMFGAAGNRFAVRVYNTGVDERTDLPTGIIVKTTNKNVPSGYNNGTRADFESDGSLIAVFAPTAENKDTYDREIKIKWKAGEEFTVYTFDLSGATLQQAYSITTTVTNGTKSGDTQILSGSTATVTITANNGYDLPENVTATGATASYNSTTGVVSLSNPTGNVTITAVCEEEPVAGLTPFSIGQDLTGAKAKFDTSFDPTSFLEGLTYSGDNSYELVRSSVDGGVVSAVSVNGVYLIGVDVEQQSAIKVVFATAAFPQMGITEAGWQQTLDENGEVEIATGGVVDEVALDEGWNGVFIGVVVGEPGPAPSLTPFRVGQTITGIDFGNVQNGDTNATMDAFLNNLDWEHAGEGGAVITLVQTTNGEALGCYNLSVLTDGALNGYCVLCNFNVLYSTVAGQIPEGPSVTIGYQNLTSGKYAIAQDTVTSFDNTIQGWNGTLIGAVEAQQSLTPFAENDVVTGIRFDTSLSVAQVKNIVSGLDFTGAETQGGAEFIYLLGGTNTDGGTVAAYNLLLAARINLGGEGYTYLLHAIEQGASASTPVWSSDAIAQMGVSEGFQNLTDGVFDFGYTGGVTIGAGDILQGSVWNGIIAGKE